MEKQIVERKEYSAGAVKWSFWFAEFKRTVSLLNNGLTMDEIRQKNIDENLFAASSAARATMIMGTVDARIKSMPSSFISLFENVDVATQKILCLTGCMCQDTLFFEFVYEVIREKIMLGINSFSEKDLRIFFAGKQQQSEKVAKWTDQTLARLGRCYKTMLFESGITDKAQGEHHIFRPNIYSEVENWMKANGLTPVWKALEGVA